MSQLQASSFFCFERIAEERQGEYVPKRRDAPALCLQPFVRLSREIGPKDSWL
jgi:hypothetical protein